MAETIDGKKIADGIIKRIRLEIKKNKLKPRMSAILAGNNQSSFSYISQKEKAAKKAGIDFSLYCFPGNIEKEDLIKKIKKISRHSSGTIIQLPLPGRLKTQDILNALPEEKDIDVLSEKRLGKFYSGNFSLLPPVVGAFSCIVKEKKIKLKGANITIVGSGRLVGKPLAVWLMAMGASVSIINKFTENPLFFTRKADIVVSGAGQQGIIKASMLKKGVIAVDAGSSFEKGKIKGDFDESAYKKASLITPVPGGVGPITTACLIENLIKINKL